MAVDRAPKLSGATVFFPPDFGRSCSRAEVRQVTCPLVAIIDDDEALCSSLVDLMRATGYRAEPFLSGEAFLTSSECSDCDCIIADIHMPGMGGLDLVRELQGRGIMTPVILITALPDKHLDDEAASTGALCLLRKPFETSSLLDYVERSLLR
jgi:FixJ family two-component response regulator